jgi:hypothetical protein
MGCVALVINFVVVVLVSLVTKIDSESNARFEAFKRFDITRGGETDGVAVRKMRSAG